MQTSQDFLTWTICAVSILVAAAFFISRVVIYNQVNNFAKISEAFDINRVPSTFDEIAYSYYDAVLDALLNLTGSDNNSNGDEDIFLNADALNQVQSTTFQGLRSLVIFNLISNGLKSFLAIIIFIDVSVLWIQSAQSNILNKVKRARDVYRFKVFIRVLEVSIFVVIAIVYSFFVSDAQDDYNVFPSLVILLLSVFVLVLYITGRTKLRFFFVTTKLTGEASVNKIWIEIKRVSAVIIVASVGVVIVQIYSIATIQNFDDYVDSANDPTALSLFLFQDVCIFAGQVAIFHYLAQAYFRYRASLFEPMTTVADIEEEEDEIKNSKEGINTDLLSIKSPAPSFALKSDFRKTKEQFDSVDSERSVSKLL